MVQSTNSVLMIEPANFYCNPQTFEDNSFMHEASPAEEQSLQAGALKEFLGLKSLIEAHGVNVKLYKDYVQNNTPDSIYPNNWFSTHGDSTCVFYPMKPVNRRRERRPDIVNDLKHDYGYIVDLTACEHEGRFLEGTGSMVLDRANRTAYATLSARTNPELLEFWAREMDYKAVLFHSFDQQAIEIYHTNCLMAIGTGFAIICLEAIKDQTERSSLLGSLKNSGHEVIDINYGQMESFSANALELKGGSGQTLICLSQGGWQALSPQQQGRLSQFGKTICADLGTIEKFGGGSARCMLAELF